MGSRTDAAWPLNARTFVPNAAAPPTAAVYAGGVPGTNGLAFDAAGTLWTGDGTTGRGQSRGPH